MQPKGANGVGRFSVEIELANNDDLALRVSEGSGQGGGSNRLCVGHWLDAEL
jgi:hypothetical protein